MISINNLSLYFGGHATPLLVLFDEINKMEKKEIGTMIFTNYKDRFQIFIGISLILLILNLIILQRKNNWKTNINLVE